MGTCLAVIKVIGTTSLGLYAGAVLSATSGYDIMVHVLKSSAPNESSRANALVKRQVTWYGYVVGALGAVASTAFHLAYSSAPKSLKHPYLIYAALVFPLSSAIWYGFSGTAVVNWLQLPELLKQKKEAKSDKKVISDLDNSVYGDLGETSADEAAHAEDEEIESEVEAHLSQQTAVGALEKLHFANKLVSALSVCGFVLATVGVYGDH